MSQTEITLLISVFVIGAALLRWAHVHGLKQKSFFENEAILRLGRDLQGIDIEKEGYELFGYIIFWGKEHGWGKTTYQEMKEGVVQNCTKNTGGGNGEIYASTEYSISINKEDKVIYYVIGENAYDFSEIKYLKAHNKSFKLPAKNQQAGTREELRAP